MDPVAAPASGNELNASHAPEAAGALPLDELEHRITELAAHLYAGTYRWLCLLREFDERGGWHGWGIYSCAHWLNWKCGLAMGAAREKLRVAHALASLPKVSEAFAHGRLSYSKVRALTRVADQDNEDYLLALASGGTASQLELLVRAYRAASGSTRMRGLSASTSNGGSVATTSRTDHSSSRCVCLRSRARS